MKNPVNTAEKRVRRTKGNCHLTHGADAYEKPQLARRQRELSKVLCMVGLQELEAPATLASNQHPLKENKLVVQSNFCNGETRNDQFRNQGGHATKQLPLARQ